MDNNFPGQNLRNHVRLLSLNLVSYTQYNEEGQAEQTAMGRTLDLSTGGIKLEVNEPYPLSTNLEFTLQIKERLIEVKGRVVHVEELKNGKVGMGIKFTDIDPDDKDHLENFLATI